MRDGRTADLPGAGSRGATTPRRSLTIRQYHYQINGSTPRGCRFLPVFLYLGTDPRPPNRCGDRSGGIHQQSSAKEEIMKRNVMLLGIIVVAAAASAAVAGDHPTKTESGWFDLENCVFCKNMMEDPGLLPHMTWENHKIANGMLQIFTVTPEYAESYAKCMQAMETVGNDMMNGKVNPMEAKMCGSCAAYGQLMMAGAKMENVKGDAADCALMTSEDPAVVAKIHEFCDRNNKEMALLMGGAEASHAHQHAH